MYSAGHIVCCPANNLGVYVLMVSILCFHIAHKRRVEQFGVML